MKKTNTYLNFPGNAEEAFNFYRSVFGGEFDAVVRMKDMPQMPGMEQLSDEHRDKIMHMALPLGNGDLLMCSDMLPEFKQVTFGNNVYVSLEVESAEEAERLFNGLSAGGQVEMPLEATPWAEKFGMFTDKFGVQWMVNYTGSVQFEAGQEGTS